jgi:rubrerythrin
MGGMPPLAWAQLEEARRQAAQIGRLSDPVTVAARTTVCHQCGHTEDNNTQTFCPECWNDSLDEL